MRSLLAALAALVLCAPFVAAAKYLAFRSAVSRQESAPPATADGRRAALPPVRSPAGSAPPVVLAYHDVGPARGPYTVTPRLLDRQLAALRKAGYHSLTSEEFLGALHGDRVPDRSVYLTFDDGTHGLWVHADAVLARHRMHGAVFVITGSVGTHRPYYLSWQEIGRMARSGRWDFQDHTRATHRRARIDAAGHRGSALTDRIWLPAAGRTETPAEYRRRVAADLDASVADLTGHGLPRPRLFAYPFSESGERTNLPGGGMLPGLLRERFAAALTNSHPLPLPAGPRAAAAGLVRRIEVRRTTTAGELLRQVAEQREVPAGAVRHPLRDAAGWRSATDAGPVTAAMFTGAAPVPAGRSRISAPYRPHATADWTDYTATATADRLRSPSDTAALTVRSGGLHPLTVTLSAMAAVLDEGPGGGHRSQRLLRTGGRHTVRVTVTGDRTVVAVDGRRLWERRHRWRPAAQGNGGIALTVREGRGDGRWPRLTHLTVTPAARPPHTGHPPHRTAPPAGPALLPARPAPGVT
ncbi:polysaccharide deacetylase family protein [Streptomyces sp. NPDC059740]|uniref:polysaccharide deacetylase family protein n=1 Tax=Streptomyces sp. NPDC059740 TaxID=3346926 RepID=UPI00364C69D5